MSLISPGTGRGQRSPLRVKRPADRRSLSRSATRALDVLEFFGVARRPLRAVEISRMLGMHPSTTNQLLKTMVDSAHLLFDARSKSYLPSPRLAEFGAWLVESYGNGGRLRDLVKDIADRVGMVVTVTTANDLFMQIIELAVPDGQIAERGLQVSLFGSAIGSAYLSMLEDGEVARLADRARIAPAELPTVLDAAARIRREGYAHGPSPDNTIWSIAIPLPMQGFRVPTVLGLAGQTGQVRDHTADLLSVMREAVGRWIGDPKA